MAERIRTSVGNIAPITAHPHDRVSFLLPYPRSSEFCHSFLLRFSPSLRILFPKCPLLAFDSADALSSLLIQYHMMITLDFYQYIARLYAYGSS